MPRYELIEGTSSKFWEIKLSGKSFTTTYGRIGSSGQSTTKKFGSEEDASKEHDKLVGEKVRKGYKRAKAAMKAGADAGPVGAVLAAIETRTDLTAAFKKFEKALPDVPSKELHPAILASIELAQTLDLEKQDKVVEAINRVWTQFCEKSSANGGFLYDHVLTILEKTDWKNVAAGARAYKLVFAFKDRHMDFFGGNERLRVALRKNKTRLLALIARLIKQNDFQVCEAHSLYEGRVGNIAGGLLEVFNQHSNWMGDDDLKSAAAKLVVPAALKFPYMGDGLILDLVENSRDCERQLAEIIDGFVRANEPGGMLCAIADKMMNGLNNDLAKRIPGLIKQLAPRAPEWTPAGVDLFVKAFFETAFYGEKNRKTVLAKSKEKRALGDIVLGLGHDTLKTRALANWLGTSAALKAAALKKLAAASKAKRGVAFKDFNFKLLVINDLMYRKAILKPKFDLHEFARTYVARDIDLEDQGQQIVPEAKQYFEALAISKEQLAKVTELSFLEGQIYLHVIPWWDGENGAFDIKSVDDAALLPNLKTFDFRVAPPFAVRFGPKLATRGIKVLPALED